MNLKTVGILLTLLIVSVSTYFYFKNPNSTTPITRSEPHPSSPQLDNCTKPVFTHHFTDPETITSIVPPVFRNSHGTMPTMLINISGNAPLYMPTNGKIVEGSYHEEQGTNFYMWEVDVGCGITVVFDHVTEPVDEIKALFPDTPNNHSRTQPFDVPLIVETGDLVGHTTGSTFANNWNFAVYDASEKNYLWEDSMFRDKPKYYSQVCPFKFYDDSLSSLYTDLFIFSFNDITVERNLCE